MLVSQLRENRLYKLNLPDNDSVINFLNDGDTQVTITETDGSITGHSLPFSHVDYINYEGNSTPNSTSIDDYGDNNSSTISNATYILYYITELEPIDCSALAEYSEELYVNSFIKILKTDYDTIVAAYPNSATISTGASVTYSPTAVYLVDDPDSEYATRGELGDQVTYSVSGTTLTITGK